jgi:hypothetical protein
MRDKGKEPEPPAKPDATKKPKPDPELMRARKIIESWVIDRG